MKSFEVVIMIELLLLENSLIVEQFCFIDFLDDALYLVISEQSCELFLLLQAAVVQIVVFVSVFQLFGSQLFQRLLDFLGELGDPPVEFIELLQNLFYQVRVLSHHSARQRVHDLQLRLK